MATYRLSSRFWNFFWMIVTLIPGIAMWGSLLALAIPGRLGDEPASGLVGAAFGGTVFLVFSAAMAWRIHEVRISGSGLIELARTLTTTRFDVRDVRRLEGKYHRGYDNAQEWKLHIIWAGGKVTVDEFPNVREFASRIEAFNPGVGITGLWPMGPPAPSHPRPAGYGLGRRR